MRPARGLAGFLAALTLTGATWAQEPPAEAIDPEATLVEDLIVTASTPGPAWWKITDADSTVWILGAPTALPRDLAWDKRVVDRRLYEAQALLLPPDYDANLISLLIFLFTDARDLRAKEPLEQTLPPALFERFNAALVTLGQEAKDHHDMTPVVAAIRLSSLFQRPLNLQHREPERSVREIARGLRVPQRRVGDYDFMPALRSLAGTSPQAQITCLEDVLRQVEAGRLAQTAAARGWANGDLRAAVSAERGSDRCTAALPAMSTLTQRVMTDTASAIAKAMDTPGKTVAVVDLRPLLAKGGVIEQLRAQGFEITSPAALQEEKPETP